EAEAVRLVAVVERLDSEPIAREKQLAGVALDDGEGKHAVQPFDKVLAPGVVGLDEHLRVAGGKEAVSPIFERATELPVVVDRAVIDDREPELRIDHRLLRVLRKVDDAQAPVAERRVAP